MMTESFKKNKYGIMLMLLSSVCVCIGQLFWKISSEKGLSALAIGFFIYCIGAILMIIAYRYGSLSVLQPILSVNYIFSTVLSVIVLHEYINTTKIIGIVIIILGVIFIAGGDE